MYKEKYYAAFIHRYSYHRSQRNLKYSFKQKSSCDTGFTLIELLVIIAVISLLMVILIPALSNKRKQAQAAVCKSNLRQIGVAANLYAENWNSFLPRGIEVYDPENGIYPWFDLFMPHLGRRPVDYDYRKVKIYRCPSYPDKKQTVCYVINNCKFNEEGEMIGEELNEMVRLTPYKRRDTTIYLADYEHASWTKIIEKLDTSNAAAIGMFDVWKREHLPWPDSDERRVARNRHRDGCHCLYIDWHVDYVAAEDMTMDMWRFKN